jgi:hypothetical protein
MSEEMITCVVGCFGILCLAFLLRLFLDSRGM